MERRIHRCTGASGDGRPCLARPVWAVLVRRFDAEARPWIEVLGVCAAHLRPTRTWQGGVHQQVQIVPLATMRGGSRQAMPPAWNSLVVRWR